MPRTALGFQGKCLNFFSFSFFFFFFFERLIGLLFRGPDLLKEVKSTRLDFLQGLGGKTDFQLIIET